MADDFVIRTDEAGVAKLTLNRGSKFNPLSSQMLSALQEQLDDIAQDTSVRVVLLTADGKAFCAGHDLREMKAMGSKEELKKLFNQCSQMMMSITRLPQPVIAQVQGMATAAGCQLVGQCDLAVASTKATFATSGINVGLFCSTPSVAVSRNLPRKQAMELLLTGDFIDAEKALSYGLVNQVVAPDELEAAAWAMAEKIASKSPTSLSIGKELFYAQLEQGLEAAYDLAAEKMACNMVHPDARDGVAAFADKAPMPAWKVRGED